MMNQKNGIVMPTSVGSPLLPLTIKPAGPWVESPLSGPTRRCGTIRLLSPASSCTAHSFGLLFGHHAAGGAAPRSGDAAGARAQVRFAMACVSSPQALLIAESRAIYLPWGPGCTSTRGPARQTHGCAYG